MTIFNIMLGKGKGGLEQVAVDYAEALRMAGLEVITITSPDAWVNAALDEHNLPRLSFSNLGSWDMLGMFKLRMLAANEQAHIAICHGNRALNLALWALKGRMPVVAVTHNYSIKRVAQADAAFTITRDLALEVELLGLPKERVFHLPNITRLPQLAVAHSLFQNPPVVGTMGRMVRKKAFDVFIDAVEILNQRGLQFRAVIGGDGEEMERLRARAEEKNVARTVEFLGWVEDVASFYHGIDIFVLPSHHEPFGLVLIEAMAHGLACITTDAEGPSEIVHDKEDALLVPRNDPEALAAAIFRLITDHAYAGELAAHGLQLVNKHYTLPAMARRLHDALAALPTPSITLAA